MRWTAPALLALAPLVPFTSARVDRVLGGFRAQEEVLYLWSGQHVRRLSAGFAGLAADIYWLRTVQYFGGRRVFANDRRLELLYPLVDITTTLDPRMEVAYRYGAIFLSEPPPIGAGRPQQGVAILERGARELPGSWRIRQELGFFHFLYLRDYRRASEVLMEASRIPGAAFWLKNLAADVVARGGDRRTALLMWRQIHEQSEGIVKANALVNMQVLEALEGADQLTALVEQFRRRSGRRPHTLEEMRAAGLLRAPPVDPTGVPFVYDRETGKVTVSPRSILKRVERET